MENYKDILDYFPSPEAKSRVEELVYVIDALSKKTPVKGFHPSFYVPGWIGAIQQMTVESKMNNFSSKSYYKQMNYLEFGDWIIKNSKEMAELQLRNKAADPEMAELQSESIIRIFDVIVALWINYCPEIATYCNIEYLNNTLISPAGMVHKGVSENLKSIGYSRNEKSEGGINNSFSEFSKNILYRLVGFILNIIILVFVFSIISAIFG